MPPAPANVSTVLAVNFGSSSLKTALYGVSSGDQRLLARAVITRLSDGRLTVDADGQRHEQAVSGEPLHGLLNVLAAQGFPLPEAVGHRFVHGGRYPSAQRLTPQVRAELTQLTSWAPQHQPASLAGVAAIADRWPDMPQVACFDTAFHRTMPELAERLPLPRALWDEGIRRYGFHGLSCRHVVDTVGAEQLGRAVIAHLGNGSSLTAIADGRSVDTTMAFTPDAGIFMGSRVGDVDSGLVLYLGTRDKNPLSWDDLRSLLQEQAGLRGLSGGQSDMAALLERTDADAHFAVEAYSRQIAKQVGAFAAVLGGVETLVFTGGIGEHAAPVREKVLERLAFLSISKTLIVAADEESVIARETADVVG